MKFKHVLVAVASTALVVAPTALPTVALAEEAAVGNAIVATQEASGPQVVLKDVTVNASQLKSGNFYQLKNQLKSLMLVSATKGGRDITGMIEAGLGNFSAALANKTPGTYDVPFYYGGSDLVGTAKLTVTDSSAAAAPKLADADVAAARGGVLLTVMGQGVTNEPNALPAGSFSVGAARKGADDAWYTDVTINSAAIDAYYKPLVPPVAQAKVAYDAGASSLTATFTYDAAAQKWVVETPARVTFNVTLAKGGAFEFADSATVAPSDVKGLSTDKLIALIKEKLVKKAEVNGGSVVNAYGFKVMLGTQLRGLQDGKAGTYSISFMYDGDGYNNEVVGNATLVIAEPEQPATPSAPAEPTTPTAPTTPATTPSDAVDAPASDARKPAKAAKKALPQTGDNALAIVGLFGAAGAVTAALGVTAKRR